MPKRSDLKSVLILGAGPIVIGQACEFDYAGVQACKALREEGYRTIVVNSNPATIMTDPELADATYIEPISWEILEKIIAKEKPDAILPTMGGQTALNCALDLVREGVLEKYDVELIGADVETIEKAEDRQKFALSMKNIGLSTPYSIVVLNMEEAKTALERFSYPVVVRPSFTLGGSGGGIAENFEEFEQICLRGFAASPNQQLLLEESVLGWKEFELEVVRDRFDNSIIVCSIENLDPMGVHTGDSVTVAPIQTLTDREYQYLRNAAISVVREIGVDTGGANVQFAVNPKDGRLLVIEMNPRVSRSSALASKATGFPIAKIAAKLAVGFSLSELQNEITGGKTPASFEPSLDYVVVKIPRFDFKRFPEVEKRLTTQMQSVGEIMGIGRTFKESLQKALYSLELDSSGFDRIESVSQEELMVPNPNRLWQIAAALRQGMTIEKVHRLTKADSWFIHQISELLAMEKDLQRKKLSDLSREEWYLFKRNGFSDRRIADLLGKEERLIRDKRLQMGCKPSFQCVDTCAAEFESVTDYYYSSYNLDCEAKPSSSQSILILGGGPNRIGQGIEFDYCCVHAAQAIQEAGYEAVMINCNPETVSTDFGVANRLYFEPLTLENVLSVVKQENPYGVIVHYGGQTPLKLANSLSELGVNVIGTSPDAIRRAENRGQFQKAIKNLGLKQAPSGIAYSKDEAERLVDILTYPLIVRPSYVLGGSSMEILENSKEFREYLSREITISKELPLLLDRFLSEAIEVDVDAVCDGEKVIVCGMMEHIERAGIHSGDSASCFPVITLGEDIQKELVAQTKKLAIALNVVGLLNIQFAIKEGEIYVLEVNPRASRTIPFISKASGMSWARIAAHCMLGKKLSRQEENFNQKPDVYAIKEAVFSFAKLPGALPFLGPEMKSTGEVMGVGETIGEAFKKAQMAAGVKFPKGNKKKILIAGCNDPLLIKEMANAGCEFFSLPEMKSLFRALGVSHRVVSKEEAKSLIVSEELSLLLYIHRRDFAEDARMLLQEALLRNIPYATSESGARAYLLSLVEPPVDKVNRLLKPKRL